MDKEKKREELTGTLRRVVFENPENNWTVASVDVDGQTEPVTITGALVGLHQGLPITLSGHWEEDKKYGKQFRVATYLTHTPQTVLGIERYLGSGMIDGVGPELAKRIVSLFGPQTLKVIEEEPNKLRKVSGIGPSRVSKIAAAWQEHKSIQDVMVFLRGHGVPLGFATRIYKEYGDRAIALVTENPYRLALEIWGIGFTSADSIARSLGIEATAPARMEAGVIHALGEIIEDGNLICSKNELCIRAEALLQADVNLIESAVTRLVDGGILTREAAPGGEEVLSLQWAWDTECGAAMELARILKERVEGKDSPFDKAIKQFSKEAKLELAPAQVEAVKSAMTDRCVVITGGPGVGKTTIVRAITWLYGQKNTRVALAAPTGRAAKKLTESTGAQAITLHRLLEFQPQSGGFERNAERQLEFDAIIVDEASMIDIKLFFALVSAVPSGARLIFVGDIDQLPSVGPGAVLADLMASEHIKVVRLTEIFRQASASQIIVNAHRVNNGELPQTEKTESDFYIIDRDDPDSAVSTICELVTNRIPKKFGLHPVRDIQVLAPMHRGKLGTQVLNGVLQDKLNPATAGGILKRGDKQFRAGDKVMQIRNDYDREVFNGDIGLVHSILREKEEVIVELHDGRFIRYEKGNLDQLVHAYAITVHKSQGSEYPAVVLPLLSQHYMMLQRNLLYTAMTRGRKLVIIVGSKRAISTAVKQDESRRRKTLLGERLKRAMLDLEPHWRAPIANQPIFPTQK